MNLRAAICVGLSLCALSASADEAIAPDDLVDDGIEVAVLEDDAGVFDDGIVYDDAVVDDAEIYYTMIEVETEADDLETPVLLEEILVDDGEMSVTGCGRCETPTATPLPNERGDVAVAAVASPEGADPFLARAVPSDNMCLHAPFAATAYCVTWRAAN